jgi:hypothetical protein
MSREVSDQAESYQSMLHRVISSHLHQAPNILHVVDTDAHRLSRLQCDRVRLGQRGGEGGRHVVLRSGLHLLLRVGLNPVDLRSESTVEATVPQAVRVETRGGAPRIGQVNLRRRARRSESPVTVPHPRRLPVTVAQT